MSAIQQFDLFGAFSEDSMPPVSATPIVVTAPALPAGKDLAGELMQIMVRDRSMDIFKMQDLHFQFTNRCHHFSELMDVMNGLERAGSVSCDFSSGKRVWHLIA